MSTKKAIVLLLLLAIMIPAAAYHTVLAVLAYPWLARILRQGRPMRSFRRLA